MTKTDAAIGQTIACLIEHPDAWIQIICANEHNQRLMMQRLKVVLGTMLIEFKEENNTIKIGNGNVVFCSVK